LTTGLLTNYRNLQRLETDDFSIFRKITIAETFDIGLDRATSLSPLTIEFANDMKLTIASRKCGDPNGMDSTVREMGAVLFGTGILA